MATFQIQSAQGETFQIEAPDGISQQQLLDQLEQAGIDTGQQAAPQKGPIKAGIERGTALAKQINPIQSTLEQLPRQVGRGAGVAVSGLERAGVSPTQGITPEAARQPRETLQQAGQAIQRGAQVGFGGAQPTPQERVPAAVGEIAATALTIIGAPSTTVSSTGRMAKIASTLDDLNGVPGGTTLSLFQNPAKIFQAFKSKESVRQAYKVAADAGQKAADEVINISNKTLRQLRRQTPAKIIDKTEDQAIAMLDGEIPSEAPTLIKYRLLINQKIGLLKNKIQKLTEHGDSSVVQAEQLVIHLEAARRTNLVLDKLAPLFRQADKEKAGLEAAKILRKGLSFFKAIGRGGSAAVGGLSQQLIRTPIATGTGLEEIQRRQQ